MITTIIFALSFVVDRQTVQETLMLAANFSLGSSMSDVEKAAYVKSVINDLGKDEYDELVVVVIVVVVVVVDYYYY